MSKTANSYVIFNELLMVICHTSFGMKMTELEINVYMVLTCEQEEEPHRKNIWRENLTFEEEFIGWILPAINSPQYGFSVMGFLPSDVFLHNLAAIKTCNLREIMQ